MPGRRYFSFLGNGRLSATRQRQLLWQEHEAHYEWIQREEKLIRIDLSKLNQESVQLESQRKCLQEEESVHDVVEALQERCAAFEAAVNRYKFRLRRWNHERDRFNVIDRIISRP